MTREQAGWTSYEEYVMRKKGKDEEAKEKWEIARWQLFIQMQMHPYIKKEQKAKNPQEWIPFGWEKQETSSVDLSNKEDRDRILNILRNQRNKGKDGQDR